MFRLLKILLYIGLGLGITNFFISCGGSSGSSTGTLGVGLTDDATDLYQAVYVTIDEVQVKKLNGGAGESGWNTILYPQQTFNLLELANGVVADLGLAELEAGEYGQMRLILGTQADDSLNILGEEHRYPNYLIKNDTDNTIEDLKVSSGFQTGIKIVQGFTIAANGATELTLDFDAGRSVVQAGSSGQWLLKPTIKVLETLTNSVSGVVADDNDMSLAGALVNAQSYTSPPDPPDGWDPMDEVKIAGGTACDETGAYVLYLPPGTYNIVATREGYTPQCQEVAATGYQDYGDTNFMLTALTAADSGTLTAAVTGVATAGFSIRQTVDCGAGDVKIEVASVNVADGAVADAITLPAGMYEVVVSPEGEGTYVVEGGIEVVAGGNVDVVYSPAPQP